MSHLSLWMSLVTSNTAMGMAPDLFIQSAWTYVFVWEVLTKSVQCVLQNLAFVAIDK